MSIQIAPSIASADLACLSDSIVRAERSGADLIHLDVEDGVFIPSLTFGPTTIDALRPCSKLPFDVHLQVDNPERYLLQTVEAGADIITVHVEASAYPYRLLNMVRDLGARVGAAFLAATPLDLLPPVLDVVDVIHIMTAEPNGNFAHYLPGLEAKVEKARTLIGNRSIEIEVDGGVGPENAGALAAAGATILVAGRAIWGSPDPAQAIGRLRRAAVGE